MRKPKRRPQAKAVPDMLRAAKRWMGKHPSDELTPEEVANFFASNLTPEEVAKQLESITPRPSKPRRRPPVTVGGYHLRTVQQTAICDVVFSFLHKRERLTEIEALLAAPGLAEEDRRHYEACREQLRPLVPHKKEAAYTLAAEWFTARGVSRTMAGGPMTPAYIKREFIDLTKRAKDAGYPLKTPADWEALKAQQAARKAKKKRRSRTK